MSVDKELREALLSSRRTLIALLTPFVAIGLEYVVGYLPWAVSVEPGNVANWVVGLGIAWIVGRSIRNTPV